MQYSPLFIQPHSGLSLIEYRPVGVSSLPWVTTHAIHIKRVSPVTYIQNRNAIEYE